MNKQDSCYIKNSDKANGEQEGIDALCLPCVVL